MMLNLNKKLILLLFINNNFECFKVSESRDYNDYNHTTYIRQQPTREVVVVEKPSPVIHYVDSSPSINYVVASRTPSSTTVLTESSFGNGILFIIGGFIGLIMLAAVFASTSKSTYDNNSSNKETLIIQEKGQNKSLVDKIIEGRRPDILAEEEKGGSDRLLDDVPINGETYNYVSYYHLKTDINDFQESDFIETLNYIIKKPEDFTTTRNNLKCKNIILEFSYDSFRILEKAFIQDLIVQLNKKALSVNFYFQGTKYKEKDIKTYITPLLNKLKDITMKSYPLIILDNKNIENTFEEVLRDKGLNQYIGTDNKTRIKNL